MSYVRRRVLIICLAGFGVGLLSLLHADIARDLPMMEWLARSGLHPGDRIPQRFHTPITVIELALILLAGLSADRIARRERRRIVAATGLVCVGCGQDLRGLASSTCPECGRSFEPLELCRFWARELRLPLDKE